MVDGGNVKQLARNIVLYGVIGCFAAGVDAVLFFCLNEYAGVFPLYANVVSVLTGMTISFILNRRFNFKVTDHPVKRGLIFFSVGLLGLAISQFILWLGMQIGYPAMNVKLFSIVIVAAVQFTLNKLVSFGAKF